MVAPNLISFDREDGYIPIGSMYAIYGNIYHQYTPNVSIYTSTMDPMGLTSLTMTKKAIRNVRDGGPRGLIVGSRGLGTSR
jgi:hypothetical protein